MQGIANTQAAEQERKELEDINNIKIPNSLKNIGELKVQLTVEK